FQGHTDSAMGLVIRECRQDDDAAVRRCIVELQDFERTIDPRLRPGESMADAHVEHLRTRCVEANGRMFVADQDGTVVGLLVVLAAQPFSGPDEPTGTYALVTDLVVLSSHRGRGIGRQLL